MNDLPGPSTSWATEALETIPNEDSENLILNIKDEEAEIARLRLPPETSADDKPATVEDERVANIAFHCSACKMHEMVHYFGKDPPFVYGATFLEDTFVMRDPFQPPPPRWKPKPEYYIAVGANCGRCERPVCRDAECSFFYTGTYCLDCAKGMMRELPLEVQVKLRKQLAAK